MFITPEALTTSDVEAATPLGVALDGVNGEVSAEEENTTRSRKKRRVVSSTQGSQLVPLASTNRARHSLTSAFE